MSNALERSLNAPRTSDEDRNKIAQLERELMTSNALERSAQEDNSRLKLLLEEEQNVSKKAFEDLNSEKLKHSGLVEELAILQNKLEAKSIVDDVPPPAPLDLNSDEIQNYVNSRIREEIDIAVSSIQSKISDSENVIAALKEENEKLQKELEISKESSSEPTSSSSAEELKSIMQDVYIKACEIFEPSDEADSPTYSSQDIVKRLRAVLKAVTNERNSK